MREYLFKETPTNEENASKKTKRSAVPSPTMEEAANADFDVPSSTIEEVSRDMEDFHGRLSQRVLHSRVQRCRL